MGRHLVVGNAASRMPAASLLTSPEFIILRELIEREPEFVSGSTRMKCGTAQKLIFDMIRTTTVIQLGRVEDNRMVNVALINDKIIDRSVKMLMEIASIDDYTAAKKLLLEQGSVKKAADYLNKQI